MLLLVLEKSAFDDVSQYKFSNTVLLQVRNGNLINVYNSKEEIINHFKSL